MQCSLILVCRRCITNVSVDIEGIVTYSLHFDSLYVSVMVTLYCKKGASLMMGEGFIYLQVQVFIVQLGIKFIWKMAVGSSPLGFMVSPTIG